MQWSLERADLARYVTAQINQLFPDPFPIDPASVLSLLPEACDRLARCFRHIRIKYYTDNGVSRYNHLHSDHHAAFLYILSNTAYRAHGHCPLAEKLFLLNKALHGLDAFYAIELPEVFLFVHPLGTVLGNARYGNHFVVYQNCSVGATSDGVYPSFGDGTILYSKSSVIGGAELGDDVIVGANAFILGSRIPSHSVVVGAHPSCKVLPNSTPVIDLLFH